MKIAVVGAGIAGLGAAWLLHKQGHAVTLFEAADYLGGHSHTVEVNLNGVRAPVDTGFLVYNERTYPNLIALFDELGVASTESDMSFSVRVDECGLEWSGTNLASVFAQKRNLVSPRFWAMLADILRFNRETTRLLNEHRVADVTLGEYLDDQRYGRLFRDWYLIPMAGAIWSSPRNEILQFPLPTFLRFCRNHGLLQIFDRPRWRTVVGGAREYVRRLAAVLPDVRLATPVQRVRRTAHGVTIDTPLHHGERFDQLVLACHSDQSLALLTDADARERRLLAAVRYQPNRVVLHTDADLLPRRRAAWSAWNYLSAVDAQGTRPVAVSYLINKLQPLPFNTPVVVTLNPPFEPAADKVLAEFEYAHPLFDSAAHDAQRAFADLQGERSTWFCGAWLGYGFHEDGLKSAIAVANAIAERGSTRFAAPVLEAA
jgi:predicted NAD/FAD-binding protein